MTLNPDKICAVTVGSNERYALLVVPVWALIIDGRNVLPVVVGRLRGKNRYVRDIVGTVDIQNDLISVDEALGIDQNSSWIVVHSLNG